MTPSEKYVSLICEKSFLPFWSFSNPIGKKSKELCDVLVVCEPNIIIISVKDITVTEHFDELVQYERWVKKAVYDSTQQIYGAERFLETVDEVFSKDLRTKITLPTKTSRIIHRIAVAFGSKENFPLENGDFGKGFVHVFDEQSTLTVLEELDTITDFTNYLIAKEKFIKNRRIQIPTESDFLGFYLQTNLEIGIPADYVVLQDNIWQDYLKTKEYKNYRLQIKDSYLWDQIVLRIYNYHITPSIAEKKRGELEESLRKMNREPRINRIELVSFIKDAEKKKVNARILKPLEGEHHAYVFMPLTKKNWIGKEKELELRCMVSRAANPRAKIIIGIAIGFKHKEFNHLDICYLNIPKLDKELIEFCTLIQNELGYFKDYRIS